MQSIQKLNEIIFTKKTLEPNGFTGVVYKIFKQDMIPLINKLF